MMQEQRVTSQRWADRIGVALVFLAFGSLIILVFSPWRPLIPNRVENYLGRVGMVLSLLLAVAAAWRSARLQAYRQILVGLFILAVVVLVEWVFGVYVVDYLRLSDATPQGWAFIKLNEGFIVIGTIILAHRAFQGSLGSIYLQKGNLKLGLRIGVLTFALAVLGSIPMATLFKAQNLSVERILPWIPWLLIYVLANAAFEELMFRGLFLRKLEPYTGKFLANFFTAFVFTGLHGTVTYSADNLIFVAVTFPLALLWGYIMQKTDSAWGSILFHAGMDIPIMLGIFSNL